MTWWMWVIAAYVIGLVWLVWEIRHAPLVDENENIIPEDDDPAKLK